MRYYSNIGPIKGAAKDRDISFAIGVLESPTNNLPIGIAFGVGPDDDGLARFRLTIGKQDIPGEWRLVDREFIRIDEHGRQPR